MIVVNLLIVSHFPWLVITNKKFQLKGRVILITGGGGGLGKCLAEEIINVVLNDTYVIHLPRNFPLVNDFVLGRTFQKKTTRRLV